MKNNKSWIVDLENEETIKLRKNKRKIKEDNSYYKKGGELLED